MIFRAWVTGNYWLTLVVRASSEERARVVATAAAREYNPEHEIDEVELLEPDGPEGVLVEDAA